MSSFHRELAECRVTSLQGQLKRELLHELGFTWMVRPERCALRNPSVSRATKKIAQDLVDAGEALEAFYAA